ncbi:MAG: hypothetical protein KTR22_08220 [Flavobacteriaceae bacterium]|nr:hypothetical protein [Flavobacteriaceae bacterium]
MVRVQVEEQSDDKPFTKVSGFFRKKNLDEKFILSAVEGSPSDALSIV